MCDTQSQGEVVDKQDNKKLKFNPLLISSVYILHTKVIDKRNLTSCQFPHQLIYPAFVCCK